MPILPSAAPTRVVNPEILLVLVPILPSAAPTRVVNPKISLVLMPIFISAASKRSSTVCAEAVPDTANVAATAAATLNNFELELRFPFAFTFSETATNVPVASL